MSHLIDNVSALLVKCFEEEMSPKNEIDLRTVFGKFSMDSIASCAFGVDAQSFTNSESKYVYHARQIFRRGWEDMAKAILIIFVPGGKWMMGMLGISVLKEKTTLFFYNAIKATVEHRLNTKERRNDLVDLMIDAMKDELTDIDQDADKLDQYEKDAILNHSR
jgi:hypothetical protein